MKRMLQLTGGKAISSQHIKGNRSSSTLPMLLRAFTTAAYLFYSKALRKIPKA